MMREINNIKRMIIKVGSTSLCNEKGKIDKERMLYLISQIAKLKKQGYEIALVSSGAIASGMGCLSLESKPKTIPEKQALAAIGQARLMQIYEELFGCFSLHCAQILLNHDDFDDRHRLMNLSNTLNALMNYGVVPIINENDALSVDEIKVGDNDTLSSLLVPVIDAQLLILVSDIDGLYDKNPHQYSDAQLLKYVESVDENILAMAGDTSSSLGTGGMTTKLKAAKSVNDYGCHMVITQGIGDSYLLDIFNEKENGTWFQGKGSHYMNARKHWLMYRTHGKGKVVVDDGAKEALISLHKSLLPSGIIDVVGQFMMGQVVEIVDENQKVIAKGIVHYASDEIRLIKGHQSNEIENILGYKDYDEVIHANNIVIVG